MFLIMSISQKRAVVYHKSCYIFIFNSLFIQYHFTIFSQSGDILISSQETKLPQERRISMSEKDFINENAVQEYEVQQQNAETKVKPEKKKTGNKSGFAAGIIAAALVVGGGAGFLGTYIGNNVSPVRLPTAISGDTDTSGSTDSSTESTLPKPQSTIDTSSQGAARPLDEEKINDRTNSQLLNAEELYVKVKNTIVQLYNYQSANGYSEPVLAGYASGVMFTADGYIVTNAHVVEGAAKMTAVVPDYDDPTVTHEYEAIVLGSDSATDLAVIKIEREEPFEYAILGDSDTVRVGQDICVLGNPKSLVSSLTKGIVSGLDRASYSGSSYGCSCIQIDAAINSGNSGGALFDMYGNVVGIIDYKLVSTNGSASIDNIGFAITINEAKPVINDLMTSGYVTNRPGIGINGEAISEYYAYLQRLPSAGVYVTYIDETKPVAKSGLKVGDIISQINGIDVVEIAEIQAEVVKHNIGDTVELTVYRAKDGKKNEYDTKKITVELSELTLQ